VRRDGPAAREEGKEEGGEEGGEERGGFMEEKREVRMEGEKDSWRRGGRRRRR
jgi:hypothetical protein